MPPNGNTRSATPGAAQRHVSHAIALAKKKQWPAAIKEMCCALTLKADYKSSKSDLLKWVRTHGNSDESRAALRLIAKHDRGYIGLQALRLLHDWGGEARTVEQRAASILRRVELRSRELVLLSRFSSTEDRLEFLAGHERLDRARDLLQELSSDERNRLPKRTLLALIKAFSGHRRVTELRDLIGGADQLLRDSKAATALAYALAIEGECEEATNLLSRFDKEQYTGRAFQTLLQCAESRHDERAAAAVLDDWLHYRPDDPLPNKRRLLNLAKDHPSTLLLELSTRSAEVDFNPRDYAQLSESVIAEAPTVALEIARIGATRFPGDEKLSRTVTQLATDLAEAESAQHERLREQVLAELSEELIDFVGADELAGCGGASALHKILLDASADARGDGLLVLAKLCLSTLRVMVTRRDHKSREAPPLQTADYLSWDGLQQKRARIATLTRAICLTALNAGEDDQRVLVVLAELQSLLLEDSEFSRRLCRLAIAEAEAGAPVSREIWTTALSCEDRELHAQFQPLIAAGTGTIMPWEDLANEGARPPALQLIHPGRSLEKSIRAFGSGLDGHASVPIETRAEVMTEPTEVTVYDAHLVSFDRQTLWTLTPAGFVPPRRSSVLLHAGTKAVALKPSSSEVEIATPVLLVPGVPACFSQYFHFAGQVLPRILARLHELGPAGLEVAIALPDFAAPFIFDMLDLCGIGRDRIVLIPSSKIVRFTHARVTNPSLDDWQCAPEDIAIARRTLSAPTKARTGRRLYLGRSLSSVRSRSRTITNEAEILDIASEFGLELVDPGSMTQPEQRQLFSEAEILSGPVGAGLTNMLYLSPGSKVICLGVSESTVTIFPGLTLGQDIDFTYVFGRFDAALVNSRRFPQLPYSVKPADFRQALRSACA